MTQAGTQSWTKSLVHPQDSLHDAIVAINRSGVQIALVVVENRRLVGTITDGDIRRALLSGADMQTHIEHVIFTNPATVGPGTSREMLLKLMQAGYIHQIPVLNAEHQVIGLHLWSDIHAVSRQENTVVIMAGGFGTRMGEHTRNCPKPMLKVDGKPLLQHAIERGVEDGFSRFVISLHYLPEVITAYFGDGTDLGVDITYVCEDSPLGTAGALSLINPRPDLPFIVTNGDVLTRVRYSDMLNFHMVQGAVATMAVRQHEIQNPYGVVRLDGNDIVGFEEKPIYRSYVNAGVYVLDPVTLDTLVPNERCDMPTLFDSVAKTGDKIAAYLMHEAWMDVGSPEDLADANNNAGILG